MKFEPLPFFDERRAGVEMIVLHATAFEAEEALRLYADKKVSCHYFIGGDGEIYRLVDENKRAWHAGAGRWREFSGDINSRSIGIELANKTLGQNYFSKEQKDALSGLLKDILRRYEIKQVNIVGHSDIAPARKADPGKGFFWQELANEGIGLWPDLRDADKMAEKTLPDLLAMIGYDTVNIRAAAYAFCRRFLAGKVTTVEDVWALDANPGEADDALLQDEEFERVLRATAYKYLSESNTPCRI